MATQTQASPLSVPRLLAVVPACRRVQLLDRFPGIDAGTLQEPVNVAKATLAVLMLPPERVIAAITVLPMRESSCHE